MKNINIAIIIILSGIIVILLGALFSIEKRCDCPFPSGFHITCPMDYNMEYIGCYDGFIHCQNETHIITHYDSGEFEIKELVQ